MSAVFLLVVSLATSAIVLATPHAMSIPRMASKHKFFAHTKDFTVSSIASGGFPANPTYGVMQSFENPDDCTNHVQSISYLLDTCMASDVASVKYTCANGVATQTQYSDTVCGSVIQLETLNMNECTFGLKLINCGTSNPNDLGNGDYTALSYNQDFTAGVCENPLSVLGTVNNVCFPTDTGSVKFAWPTYYEYTAVDDCTGDAIALPMNILGCQPETDDDDGYDDDNAIAYGSYGSFSHVQVGDSSSDDALSAGAIAGIVIGGVAFLALVAGMSWFFCCRASTPLTKRENEMANSAA